MLVGQAQKEDFVNEALVRIDGLLHCAVEQEQSAPPAGPLNGKSWLVGSGASGSWAGHEGAIAIRQLDQWSFVMPPDGVQLLNKATGQRISRIGGAWRAPSAPGAVTGGAVIDAEARAAITALIAALRSAGVLPA